MFCKKKKVFCKIDELCEEYGVLKIETIGHTYLACAGLAGSPVNHAEVCIFFSICVSIFFFCVCLFFLVLGRQELKFSDTYWVQFWENSLVSACAPGFLHVCAYRAFLYGIKIRNQYIQSEHMHIQYFAISTSTNLYRIFKVYFCVQ